MAAPKRTMTPAHKKALAQGRESGRAVRDYLSALGGEQAEAWTQGHDRDADRTPRHDKPEGQRGSRSPTPPCCSCRKHSTSKLRSTGEVGSRDPT